MKDRSPAAAQKSVAAERARPHPGGRTKANLRASASPSGGQDEILLAASEAFTEKGFAATSIDDIANRLGATKGRIYHYYRSKADLFLDLQRWALEHCLERIRPLARRADYSPSQKLYAMSYEHTQMMVSGLGFQVTTVQGRETGLLNISGRKQTEALRYVVRLRDEYEDLFASVIEEGVLLGEFERVRPRLQTKPVFGALNWLLVWYHSDQPGPHASLNEIADTLATFVVNGVRKKTFAPPTM